MRKFRNLLFPGLLLLLFLLFILIFLLERHGEGIRIITERQPDNSATLPSGSELSGCSSRSIPTFGA